MATTAAELQTRLAYRLGENSAPSDANEKARRLSFLNEGQREVYKQAYWWFTQKTDTSLDTVASQETYTLPTDFRDVVEVRVNGKVATAYPQHEAFGSYNYPPLYYQYNSLVQKFFIFGETELHLLPVPSTSGTNNISLRYYSYSTPLTTDASTTSIPDQYVDCLVAYAYGRISQLDSERGSAADGFDEFTNTIRLMMQENMKRKLFNRSVLPTLPTNIVE